MSGLSISELYRDYARGGFNHADCAIDSTIHDLNRIEGDCPERDKAVILLKEAMAKVEEAKWIMNDLVIEIEKGE